MINVSSINVLVVDDDELVQELTVEMITELGYAVSKASSGLIALEIFKEKRIDLLVTDFVMPQMTGMELIKKVRIIFPKMPIILATGYADLAGDIMDISILKLLKPFSSYDLERSISSAVSIY